MGGFHFSGRLWLVWVPPGWLFLKRPGIPWHDRPMRSYGWTVAWAGRGRRRCGKRGQQGVSTKIRKIRRFCWILKDVQVSDLMIWGWKWWNVTTMWWIWVCGFTALEGIKFLTCCILKYVPTILDLIDIKHGQKTPAWSCMLRRCWRAKERAERSRASTGAHTQSPCG